mmetsp:Transcript_12250/g.27019  ORF Transcript_12250/g.27019 Transcript_12250/m.27019 type:complete len:225 (+) Transcript_12250:1353-2027(+)
MPRALLRTASAETAWGLVSFWAAIALPFLTDNVKLSSRTCRTRPPSVLLPPSLLLTGCWTVELLGVLFCEPRIVPSCLKFKVAECLANSLHRKSNLLCGVPMVAKSQSCASMASSLLTDSWNNCALLATMFVSRVGAGMSALQAEQLLSSSSTQLCTTSSTACHQAILELSEPWINHCMPCVLSRISCLAWIVKRVLESFRWMRRKLDSSWLWPRSVTARSCIW